MRRRSASGAPYLVDRDNFDDVLSRMGAEIQLAIGDGSLHLQFSELDDFHPDRIFQQLEAFGKLRELRGRLRRSVNVSASGG